MSVRALILDYGGVLTRPQRPDRIAAMADRVGVPLDTFVTAYWRDRPAYDLGLPAPNYWRRVLAALGRDATTSLIVQLIEDDTESWTDYREELWSLTASFRMKGGRAGFLSNGVPETMARLRAERQLASRFDVIIVSCEVGVAKPDPKIYELCLAGLGVPPQSALFVDDRPINVEAAQQLGLQALCFTGDESVNAIRDALRA